MGHDLISLYRTRVAVAREMLCTGLFSPLKKNSKIVILATSLLHGRDFTPFLNSLEHKTTCIIELSPFFKFLNDKEGEIKRSYDGRK